MSIGKKMTFWELINSSNIESIEIPQIQRDYVQGRHTPQVKYARERLLAEIKDALENGNSRTATINDAFNPPYLCFCKGRQKAGVEGIKA